VTLGLSTTTKFVRLLLQTIKTKKSRVENTKADSDSDIDERVIQEPNVNVDLLILKDFLKVFAYDRFGEKVCKVI
jgi:hypothetical protein